MLRKNRILISILNLVLVMLPLSVWGDTLQAAEKEAASLRIVSLAQSATQMLYDLGVEAQVVGRTSYCPKRKDGGKAVEIGTAQLMNLEKILVLKPDLVVASGLSDPRQLDKLKDFGIAVEIFDTPRDFEELCSHFLRLAIRVGKLPEAKKQLQAIKDRMAVIQEERSKEKPLKVLLQIGADPLFVVIGGNYMHEFIRYIHGENIVADLKNPAVSRESMLLRNPNCIFIVTMGVIGEEEEQEWKRYKHLDAAKSGAIFCIDSNYACVPTPHCFLKTLEQMHGYLSHNKYTHE